MDHNRQGIQWGRLNTGGFVRVLGMALLGAGAFSVVILFSWSYVMPEMFHLPRMHFKQALGATGLLFSAGFLLNSRWAHTQDNSLTTRPE